MSDDKRYNGWSSYETWNVKLWIDNDPGSYDYWREQTRECWEHSVQNQFIDSHRSRATIALADCLESEFEDQAQDILDAAHVSTSMWSDLLYATLSEVDWREIAEAMIEDAELTEDETEVAR